MKREDKIEDEIQYAYLPGKVCDHDPDNSSVFTFETTISEKQAALKQIKKLKLANKQTDIQAFLLPLYSKPLFRKWWFRMQR